MFNFARKDKVEHLRVTFRLYTCTYPDVYLAHRELLFLVLNIGLTVRVNQSFDAVLPEEQNLFG